MFDFGSHNFDFKSFDLKRKNLFYHVLCLFKNFFLCLCANHLEKIRPNIKNNYVIICLLILYGLFNTACRSQLRDVCA